MWREYTRLLALVIMSLAMTSCSSWLEPGEGNGLHGRPGMTSIRITTSDIGGGQVRLDGDAPVYFVDSYVFSGISAGDHAIATRQCIYTGGGGILDDGGSSCTGEWTFCRVFVPRGTQVTVRAGTCSH